MKTSLLTFLLYITTLVSATPTLDIDTLSIGVPIAVSEGNLSIFNLEKRKGGGGGKPLYILFQDLE